MRALKLTRRKVQIVIGLLWFIDGALQLQSKMFTSDFVNQVIKPAQAGQPFYIYDPIHFGIKIFLTHPAIFNSLIATAQMAIGLLILYRRTSKYGLWLSFLWGLFVWLFGEAAAGIFSGQSSLIVGMPGAALLYSFISLSVLPKDNDKNKSADSWLVFVWALVWVAGAVYELLPAQNSINTLKSMIAANASGAPGWLAHLDVSTANFLNHFGASTHMTTMMSGSGYIQMFVLAAVMMIIGLGVIAGKAVRAACVTLGILLSILFWFVGQSLGGYYTGVMTDVQTAPLLILMGLAILSMPDVNNRLRLVYSKIEKALV